MATLHEPPTNDALRSLLREDRGAATYDVERGLVRHRQLLAAGTPLPEWAAELPARPSTRRAYAKRAWWLIGSLSLAVILWRVTTPEVLPPHEASGSSRSRAVTPSQSVLNVAPAAEGGGEPHAGTTKRREPPPLLEEAQPEAAPIDPARPEPTPAPDARVASKVAASAASAALAASTPAPRRQAQAVAPPSHPPSALARARNNPRLDTGVASGATGRARPRPDAPLDAEEMRQLREAEQLAEVDPLRALKLVRAGNLTFRRGYFAQERRYLEVLALFALGRVDEARTYAASFLHDYPGGAYRHKVELAILRHPAR
ncbi:MAG: hypothetical protein JWN48_1237 [Myxococcaceae bacterium]|nr:hypothetical protein [Myxococcaceae bacterium]